MASCAVGATECMKAGQREKPGDKRPVFLYNGHILDFVFLYASKIHFVGLFTCYIKNML